MSVFGIPLSEFKSGSGFRNYEIELTSNLPVLN